MKNRRRFQMDKRGEGKQRNGRDEGNKEKSAAKKTRDLLQNGTKISWDNAKKT